MCPALFDSLLLRVEDGVNDFETSKLWELTRGSTPNLLADYLYLWETAVVKQAFETAVTFVSLGGDSFSSRCVMTQTGLSSV